MTVFPVPQLSPEAQRVLAAAGLAPVLSPITAVAPVKGVQPRRDAGPGPAAAAPEGGVQPDPSARRAATPRTAPGPPDARPAAAQPPPPAAVPARTPPAMPALLLPPQLAEAAGAAARGAALSQDGMAPLLANLAQLLEQPDLPAPLRAAVRAVMALQAHPQALATPQGLRQAVAVSGLFLEARLARPAEAGAAPLRPARDLKAALVNLQQVVASLAAEPDEAPTNTPRPPATPAPPARAAAQPRPPDLPATTAPTGQPTPAAASAPAARPSVGPAQPTAPMAAAAPVPTAPTPAAPQPPAASTAASPAPMPLAAVSPPPPPITNGAPSAAAAPSAPPAAAAQPATATAHPEPGAGPPHPPAAPASRPTHAPAVTASPSRADGEEPSAAPRASAPAPQSPTPATANATAPAARPSAAAASPPTGPAPLGVETSPIPLRDAPLRAGPMPPSPRPAPPMAGAAPAPQAPAPPSLPAESAPAAIARVLAPQVEAVIARQELHQIASLPTARLPDEPPIAARWSFEVPLATAHGPAVAGFEIRRDAPEGDGEGGGAHAAAAAAWRVRFAIDLEPMGPVEAQIVLRGAKAGVTLWAERPDTARRLARDGERLTSALARASFETELAVRLGAAPRAAAPPGRFLDQAT